MAKRALLQIEGARQLRATLKSAGSQIDVGDELKPAFLKAASIVAVRARAGAPAKTGAMRDTIGPGATKRGGVVRAGFKSVPYPGVINWGTPHTTGRPANIRGTHFMQDAATSTESAWSGVVFKALEDLLDKIHGK